MTILVQRDAGEGPLVDLRGRTVALLGYGNQGRAHALNLRDSGLTVVIGARPGAGANAAIADGFDTVSLAKAAEADLVICALPDEVHAEVLQSEVAPSLRPGATLGFIHGFTVHSGMLPSLPAGVGVVMVAPKGPGVVLRARYLRGEGVPCLLAVHQESESGGARRLALAWANGIGCGRAGIISTTFRDEAVTDLFGEQAVLCGGLTWLILAAFETLVEAGYAPELAYLECCHEVKQIADLVYAGGLAGMMRHISNTAEFGAHVSGPQVVDESTRQRMRDLLARIENGAFARAFRDDYTRGFSWFESRRADLARHPIETAGKVVRSLMPWLGEGHPT